MVAETFGFAARNLKSKIGQHRNGAAEKRAQTPSDPLSATTRSALGGVVAEPPESATRALQSQAPMTHNPA